MRNWYVDLLSLNGQGNSVLEDSLKPKPSSALGLVQAFAGLVLVPYNFIVAQ